MPIQLRHTTQATQAPSALSHGVGVPVSDGGAGAISRALGQVAGAASQIGQGVKRRSDAAKRKQEQEAKQAVDDAATKYRTEVRAATNKLRKAAKSGNKDAVAAAQRELDVLKRTPLTAFHGATDKDLDISEDVWASQQLRAQEFYVGHRGSAELTVNIDEELKRKDKLVQDNSLSLASERSKQAMNTAFNDVLTVLSSNDSAAIDAALSKFSETFVDNPIDGNQYIKTDDGEVSISSENMSLWSERQQTSASMLYRQLHTKVINSRAKAVQMAQIHSPAEKTRAIVAQSVESYVPVPDVVDLFTDIVSGYNHSSVAGYQGSIQGELAELSDTAVDAFIRSIPFSEEPAALPEEVLKFQNLLGDESVQEAIGSKKAGQNIDKLDRLYSDLYTKPDISGYMSELDSFMSVSFSDQNLPIHRNTLNISRQAANAKKTLDEYGDSLTEAEQDRLTSSAAVLGSRAEFALGLDKVRSTAYDFISQNPELTSQAIVGALQKTLGLNIADVSVDDQIQYGNYLKGFYKKVASVEELYGEDSYEMRRWLGGQQTAQVAAEGDAALSKLIDSAITSKNSGETISLDPKALDKVRDAYGVTRGDYVGLSVLHDIYTNPATRGNFGIAAQTIGAVWGDAGVNIFISKNSAEDAPTMNRELALIHSMASMSSTDTVSQVAEQVQMVNEDTVLESLPALHQKDAYRAVLTYRSGRSAGKVDRFGNKIKTVFGSDLDQMSEGVYDIGAQLTQAYTVEGDTVGATMWANRVNAMIAQEIRNHTDGPIDPRKIYDTVMNNISSEVTVAQAPNGSAIVVPMKSMTHNWVAEGVSPEDAGLVMMHSAVNTATRLGVDIAKELRGVYAIKSTDDEVTVAKKERMQKYESDEEFLYKAINQQVPVEVNGQTKFVSALRLGMVGMDAKGNSVRALLFYNPNTGSVQNAMKKDGTPIMISERALQMGVDGVQAKKLKHSMFQRISEKLVGDLDTLVPPDRGARVLGDATDIELEFIGGRPVFPEHDVWDKMTPSEQAVYRRKYKKAQQSK